MNRIKLLSMVMASAAAAQLIGVTPAEFAKMSTDARLKATTKMSPTEIHAALQGLSEPQRIQLQQAMDAAVQKNLRERKADLTRTLKDYSAALDQLKALGASEAIINSAQKLIDQTNEQLREIPVLERLAKASADLNLSFAGMKQ